MDTPEQPTIWPPAPTLPPPEAEKTKPFRLMLPVPEWLDYWLKTGLGFLAVRSVVPTFCEADHLPVPIWATDKAMFGAWFVFGGLMVAWKYRPRKEK